MTDSGIVLKTESGLYYCGMNVFNKQLRMAKIYHSKRYAEEAKESLEKKTEYRFSFVNIEIREVE